jgi:hypothetical protein
MRELKKAVKAINNKFEARRQRLETRRGAYLQAAVKLEAERRETAALERELSELKAKLSLIGECEADLADQEAAYALERVDLNEVQKTLLEEANDLLKEL